MPRYITSGANFTPFTYEELVRPIDNMTQAHNAAVEQYDNLATTTAQLEQYIKDNPDDEETRAVYNSYMSTLQRMQDSLYGNGYNANTARDLSAARKLYGQQIVPMSEAIQRRRTWNDKYLQMQMEHPEMIMGRAPGTYAVKDYMNDTNFGGFRNYSSNQLTSDASAAAKEAASALQARPRKWTTSGVPAGYYQTEMTTGYTEKEVEEAMKAFRAGQDSVAGDSETALRANDLLQIAKDIYAKSGISEWQGEGDGVFNRAADAIGTGLRSAIGETKYEMVQRRDGIYSPNYKPKTDGDKPPVLDVTRYSMPVGLDVTNNPDLKKIVDAYNNDIDILKYIRSTRSGNSEDAALANAVDEYKNLKRDLSNSSVKHTSEMRDRVKELETQYPSISSIAFPSGYSDSSNNDYKIKQIYKKYNISDDASIDNAIDNITKAMSQAEIENRYFELNAKNTEYATSKIASNTGFILDRINNNDKRPLEFVSEMNGKLDVTAKDFNDIITGTDKADLKYQVRPYSGDIIMQSTDRRLVLNPAVFSNSALSNYSAYDVANAFYAEHITPTGQQLANELYRYLADPNKRESFGTGMIDAARIISDMPEEIEYLQKSGIFSADEIKAFINTAQEVFWASVFGDTNDFLKVRGKTGDKQ